MKKSLAMLVATALVVTCGCNSKSSPGGPGAGGTTRVEKADTFTLKVPSTTTDIKQGEAKEVTLTIDRGKDFKEDVKLSATSEGKGVTVTPNPAELKASDKATELKFKIEAAKDAAIGEHNVTVKATPSMGAATEKTFKVKVTGA